MNIDQTFSHQSDSAVQNHPNSSAKKITIMVLVLVGIFLFSNIIGFIFYIMRSLTSYFGQCFWMLCTHESDCDQNQYQRFEVITCLSIFAETFSSSVNVIIYGMFGEKFRKTFREIFCHKCLKNQEQSRRGVSLTLTKYLQRTSKIVPIVF